MLITPNPATPAGAAIIDLATLMDDLQARTGEWPGAETADILSGWLSRFSFAVPTALTAQRVGRAWVLRRWDRRSEEVTLWSDEASALASLAQAEANSAAVFHPMEGTDDEGLPCIEIAGVLAFAYLDADTRAVRVSVHLDTTDEQVLLADGTVPVQVDVEDATVFTRPPTSPAPTPTGWRARLGRLARRATRPGGGERRGLSRRQPAAARVRGPATRPGRQRNSAPRSTGQSGRGRDCGRPRRGGCSHPVGKRG
ncbi:hypothetical protein [Streptomyces sp. SudanB66_2053]|uniref:hypothetical protein n=1 Tax=Streptomyces sp. SudanB66_2053 TaxID=3035277 RepID=UPI003F573373